MKISHKAVAFTHLSSPYQEFSLASANEELTELIDMKWGETIKYYCNCDRIRLIFLFFSEAYQYFMANGGESEDFQARERLEVQIKEHLCDYIENKHPDYRRKFRLIGYNEMAPLIQSFMSLGANMQSSFPSLVLGQGSKLNYDCPKVVEAIIRIARRLKGEVILRFDEDVKVEDEPIDILIAHYENLTADKKVYFFFSGNYHRHDVFTDSVSHLLNDHAVRTHFLSVDDRGQGVSSYNGTVSKRRKINASQVPFSLETELAREFLQIMDKFGAPRNQPISGAGLCISPMAIVQLPPFANVSENIVWIDDSIKRSLHEGIGDISINDSRSLDQASFLQERHKNDKFFLKDVRWGYNTYLPRLIYGCIMHSLILDLAKTPPSGPYSEAFSTYMGTHQVPASSQREEWATAAKDLVDSLRKAILSNKVFQGSAAGQELQSFAEKELTIKPTKLIDRAVMSPLGQNRMLDVKNRHGGVYIARVIADLQRYIELMNIWPIIIRTIDFEVRTGRSDLDWLVAD